VEQQLRFALKICIACLHVGQMLFAGNKYLLLKRITVCRCTNVPTLLDEPLVEQGTHLGYQHTGNTIIYWELQELFDQLVMSGQFGALFPGGQRPSGLGIF